MPQDSGPVPPPQGIVTLLFTDVQGSTAGWERQSNIFGEALLVHDRKLRDAISGHNGFIVKTAGDAFMAAFGTANDAVHAALTIQRELAAGDESEAWQTVGGIRVRIGIHTGEPVFREDDYFGPPVNRAARICDAGHGGMILLSRASLTVANFAAEPPVRLIDHGFHKLKDLGDPEHLFELRDDELPSPSDERLRTLEARHHNFPAQVTSLVGRTKELADLHGLISQHHTRLITITGPGGTGKTRLALQVAADRLQDYPDGVWMVDLAGTYDPAFVPTAIAMALQLDLPAGADPKSVLISYLRSRRSMLVLDNFEQVADAARVVSDLLKECGDLACLVTSRELLRITGETEYAVEPLSVPPPGEPDAPWESYESVQLFVERCRLARADFELTEESAPLVGEICRRLDGIPLAIELAAARIRGMTLAQILQRLSRMFDLLASGQRDLPERQRTLRSAIDWSYSLLTEEEREILGELSVFVGGFTLDAAEEVCLTPGAFDAVFSLRDKSLLKMADVQGESRYSMLGTIREYAGGKLMERGAAIEVHNRHSEYYLACAADLSAQLASAGAETPEAMRTFTVELDNIRAGMDWAAQGGLQQATVEYAKALFVCLRRRGLYTECDTRLTLGEDAAREIDDEVSLARILNQRALVAYDTSKVQEARELFQRSYALSKKLDDRSRMLVSLINLGSISWATSRFQEARVEWEEALALAIETKQPRYEAFIREDLGILARQEGRVDEAQEQFTASLALHKKAGNQQGLASSLYNSSDVYRKRKQYDEALRRVTEAREIYTSIQDQRGLALTAVRAGLIERERGEFDAALGHIREGLEIARTTGYRHPEMFALLELARHCLRKRDLDGAGEFLNRSIAIANEVGDRKHTAEAQGAMSILRSLQGRMDEAESLRDAALKTYSALGLMAEDLELEGVWAE